VLRDDMVTARNIHARGEEPGAVIGAFFGHKEHPRARGGTYEPRADEIELVRTSTRAGRNSSATPAGAPRSWNIHARGEEPARLHDRPTREVKHPRAWG